MARRIGLALVTALGIVLLLLVAAFAALQTGAAKRLLAAQLERALAAPDATVELAAIEGLVPFDLKVGRVAMADAAGAWLEVTGLRFDWSPRALLAGRLVVEELSAERIELSRPPPAAPEETAAEPFRLPELPGWVPPLRVERLAVDEFRLGAPVLGQPAAFALAGRLAATDDGRAISLDLIAERTDQGTARATVDARLDLDPAALKLTVEVAESGGLLAALSGRPEAGDFELKLSGSGPLDAWTGELRAVGEDLMSVHATLGLNLAPTPGLRVEGELRPAPALLPEGFRGLVGDRLGLTLAVIQTAPQRLTIEELRASVAIAAFAGRGDVDLEAERIDVRMDLEVPELAPLGDLIGTPLAGRARATLTATGAPLQPEGRLELALDAPAAAGLRAERIASTVRYAALTPLDGPGLQVQIAGEGQAGRLELPAAVPLPAQNLTWRFDLSGTPEGPVTIRDVAVNLEHAGVQANGVVDPTAGRGQATLHLDVAALGPLTEPFGQRVEGALTLDAEVDLAEQFRALTLDLTGAFSGLAGLPPGAAELLGAAPRLAAKATLDLDRRLEVSALTVEGAAASLRGTLGLTLPEEALDGRLTLTLPRLATIGPALGQELAGAVELVAAFGGSLGAPSIDVEGRGRELLLAGQPIDAVSLAAAARGLPATPEGTVELAVTAAGLKAVLATAYRLEAERLTLRDLRLTAPRSRIEGRLAVDLERTLIEGELRGQVQDLVAFQPLLPVPVRGRLGLEARLVTSEQRQNVILSLDGSEILAEFGQLRRLRLDATVADALATPRIEATLTLDGVRQDQIEVSRARLSAAGTLAELALDAALEGKALQPFTLETRATLEPGEPLRLRVATLTGSFAGEPLRLEQPAALSIADGRLGLDGLRLRLGAARLDADLALGPDEVAGDATLAALPLAWLARFGGPELTGQTSADLRLEGPAGEPRAVLELAVRDLRVPDPNFAELPAATLAGRAELAGRRLSIELRGEGVTDRPIVATLALPAVVRLDQMAFELPGEGAIAGRLDAELRLARFVGVAGLDDQRLDGLVSVDLAIAGSVNAPRVTGSVALADGLYDNGTTGTVLRDISLQAQATERVITIEQLAATDGAGGRLALEGTIGIEPATGFPVDLRLRLRDAELVRRDDVTAALSGDLGLEGRLMAARVAGRVEVERAEIRIPEGFGPAVPVVEVEEIGGTERRREAKPSRSDDAFELGLDVRIDLPGRVFVRGRGLESEWQGRLRVTGTASAPRLAGDLNVRRGYFDFLDKRFELREGNVSFSGATPPAPTVAVEAVAAADGLTAIVRAEGPATKPTLTLDSEPSLPQDEVLARLLFNRSASELGPAQAAQLALAVNRLRGGSGFDLLGEVRAVLGVDTLDVTGGGTVDESKVRAGKYLSDDVYVEVEKGAAERSGRAKVEVEILPNVSIEADTGEDARSGVGVKWRYDY